MSDSAEFAARDDMGTPAAEDGCGIGKDGLPNTGIGWVLNLEALSAVLEDDAGCAVITMGATAVLTGGTRSVGGYNHTSGS